MAVALLGDIKDFTNKMDTASGKVSAFDKNVAKMGAAVTKYAKMAALAAVAAVSAFAVSSTKYFIDVDTGMREVFTLMPELSATAKEGMLADVMELSETIAVVPDEVIPALYQAISAGVPKENVFTFLEVAGKAAIGGVTSLEVAVDGLTTVTNAYGSEVLSVQEAADIMFTTVKLGKTTFELLSERLFQAVPIAASVGLEFSNIAAMAAQITLSGVPMRVAMTQIRSLINEVAFEGKELNKVFQEAAGMTFPEFIATGADAGDIMKVLEGAAAKAGKSVAELTANVEAQQAMLNLSGAKLDNLNRLLLEFADSTGAYEEAYEEMAAGIQHQLNQLKVWWKLLKLDIGGDLTKNLQDLLGWLAGHREEIAEGIKAVFDGLRNALQWMIDNATFVKASLLTISVGLAAVWAKAHPLAAPLLAIVTALKWFESSGGVEDAYGHILDLAQSLRDLAFGEEEVAHTTQAMVNFLASGMSKAASVVQQKLQEIGVSFFEFDDIMGEVAEAQQQAIDLLEEGMRFDFVVDQFKSGVDVILDKYGYLDTEIQGHVASILAAQVEAWSEATGVAIGSTKKIAETIRLTIDPIKSYIDDVLGADPWAGYDTGPVVDANKELAKSFTTTEIYAAEKALEDLTAELSNTAIGSLDYIVVVEKLRAEYAKLVSASEAVTAQDKEVEERLFALIAAYVTMAGEAKISLDKNADDVRTWGDEVQDIVSSTLADVLWDFATFYRDSQDAEEDHQQRMQDIIEGAGDKLEDINLEYLRRRDDADTDFTRKRDDIDQWYRDSVEAGDANTHEKRLALDAEYNKRIEAAKLDLARKLEDLDTDYTRATEDNTADRIQALADEEEAYEETIPTIASIVDSGIKSMVNSVVQSGIDKAAEWFIEQLWSIADEAELVAEDANTSLASIGTSAGMNLALAAVPLVIGTSSEVAEGVASVNKWITENIAGGTYGSGVTKTDSSGQEWVLNEDGEWVKKSGGLFGAISRRFSNEVDVPSYAMGGIIPGAPGEPVLIEAHGGEPIGAAGFAEVLDYERLGNAVAAGVADAMDDYMGDGRPIIVQLPDGTKLAQALYPPLQKESQRRGGTIL